MIDIALGVLLVLVLYRGYRRGLIRELLDVAVLLVAALVAFRTAGLSSAFFTSWTGASPIVARLLGGFVVFFLIQLGGSILLRRFIRRLGPVRTADRVGGIALSGAWFVASTVLLLLVASAVPLGDPIEGWLDDSTVAQWVAGEDSAAKEAVSAVVGDRVLEALVNLNQLIGENQVVIEGAESVEIPAAEGSLERQRDDARRVFDLLNLARIDADADPLAWSAALADIAAGHGEEMYRNGYFSHRSPTTGDVADRVSEVGIVYRFVGENLALSPTAESVHEGLMDSPGHYGNMVDVRFTRVGVSAIEGPLGLMVVEVFTG